MGSSQHRSEKSEGAAYDDKWVTRERRPRARYDRKDKKGNSPGPPTPSQLISEFAISLFGSHDRVRHDRLAFVPRYSKEGQVPESQEELPSG